MQERVDRVLGSLGIPIEVKNQARVHLWYEEHFGFPYPTLANAKDGIDRFLIPSTCVGVRPLGGAYEIYAPNGLSILYAGVLAPNPLTCHLPLFWNKVDSYLRRWDWLQVREAPPRSDHVWEPLPAAHTTGQSVTIPPQLPEPP